jgi:hypothetical protein
MGYVNRANKNLTGPSMQFNVWLKINIKRKHFNTYGKYHYLCLFFIMVNI